MRPCALAVATLVAGSAPLAGQSTVVSVDLSADSVEMAEVFELRVRFDVPPASTVYFSDTIPATGDVESFSPVTWRADRAAEGEGATVVLTYPLMSFGEGSVAVPTPVVMIGPAGDAEGEGIPGGSVVGEWSDAPAAGGRRFLRIAVPEPRAWIAPVQSEADVLAGAPPRGPDDVLGTSWSWPHVVLVGFFSSILAAAGHTKAREWLGNRKPAAPTRSPSSSEEARRVALAEIERLIAEAPYGVDGEKGAYAASSDALRGYVAQLAPGWVPGLTSTEMMAPYASEAEALTRAMATAERVKFGRHRTGEVALRTHLTALRDWLREPRS